MTVDPELGEGVLSLALLLRAIENYLVESVDEYQQDRPRFPARSPCVPCPG